MQNLSSGLVEWSCAVVITTTTRCHWCHIKKWVEILNFRPNLLHCSLFSPLTDTLKPYYFSKKSINISFVRSYEFVHQSIKLVLSVQLTKKCYFWIFNSFLSFFTIFSSKWGLKWIVWNSLQDYLFTFWKFRDLRFMKLLYFYPIITQFLSFSLILT